MGPGVLVIGYGNELRADDGAGPAVANLLADDPRCAGARVETVRQLTPDLALDVAAASLVVLVDASTGQRPGKVVVGPLGDDATSGTFSHHLGPAALAGLAATLYDAAPRVVVVSVGVATLEFGAPCSPAVASAIPRMADLVAGIVAEHQAAGTGA